MISQYQNGLGGLGMPHESCNCTQCSCGVGGLRGMFDHVPAIGLDYSQPEDWAQMAFRFASDAFSGKLSPSTITSTMDFFGIDPAEQPAVRNMINGVMAFAQQQGWTEVETQNEIRRLLATDPPKVVAAPAPNNTMLYVALAVVAVLLLRK